MLSVAAKLAYRQLTHRGSKLAGALLGVCVAIILMFTQVGFRNALYDSAIGIPRALDGELFIAGPTFHSWADSPPWMARGLLYEAERAPGVLRVIPFYSSGVQIASPVDGHSLSAYLLAFPAHERVFLRPDINRYLDDIVLEDRVIMDRKSRDDFPDIRQAVERDGVTKVALLSASRSLQKTIEIGGLFGIGPSFTIDGSLITSDTNFYRFTDIPLDRVELGIVRLRLGADAGTVKAEMQKILGDRAQVFTKREFLANEISYYANETPIGYIFRMGLIVGTIVGVVFISQALHGIVNDNIREYATLRAMGYPQRFFVMLVATIALVISAVAYVPSVLVSWGIYALASSATMLPLQMKPADMLSILGVVAVMGLAATFLAIRKLKTANPVDLFA